MDSTFCSVLGYDQSNSPLCSGKGEEFLGHPIYYPFLSMVFCSMMLASYRSGADILKFIYYVLNINHLLFLN
jgi:hypothetical protein